MEISFEPESGQSITKQLKVTVVEPEKQGGQGGGQQNDDREQ